MSLFGEDESMIIRRLKDEKPIDNNGDIWE
jgi:hypothetical protein